MLLEGYLNNAQELFELNLDIARLDVLPRLEGVRLINQSLRTIWNVRILVLDLSPIGSDTEHCLIQMDHQDSERVGTGHCLI